MSLCIGLDLEPGIHFSRALPDLDLLDVAYGAVHGGVQVIMLPILAVVAAQPYTPAMFKRPGLPLLALKVEENDLDRVPATGDAADRIVIFGESGRAIVDTGYIADRALNLIKSGQEVGVFCTGEISALKELARRKAHWVYLPTDSAFQAKSAEEANTEIARLQSAALTAQKLGLRVAFYGPTGRHLPMAIDKIAAAEELFPAHDLWSMALRLGWERAVAEYRQLLR